jgi:hypothetical protein
MHKGVWPSKSWGIETKVLDHLRAPPLTMYRKTFDLEASMADCLLLPDEEGNVAEGEEGDVEEDVAVRENMTAIQSNLSNFSLHSQKSLSKVCLFGEPNPKNAPNLTSLSAKPPAKIEQRRRRN